MDTIDSITNDKLIQYGHAILGQNEYNEISKAYVEWKNIVQIYVVKNGFNFLYHSYSPHQNIH